MRSAGAAATAGYEEPFLRVGESAQGLWLRPLYSVYSLGLAILPWWRKCRVDCGPVEGLNGVYNSSASILHMCVSRLAPAR